MSPSLKSFDYKTKCVRLTQNCIVVSFRKTSNYYLNSDESIVLPEIDNVKPQSWSDNNNEISPAGISFNGNESESYFPLQPTSPTIRCTCNQVDGWSLFNQFLNENSMSVWNPYLVSCLAQLSFLGFLYPSSLLIGGTEFSLEVLRSAWSRRILKAPQGFTIEFIGDISYIESSVVNQTQFTPLAEALCKCINELNIRRISATFDFIVKRLQTEFPNMELPSEKILRNSLKTLVQERKLFYNNEKECFFATSYNYQFDNSLEDLESLSLKNQHLLTSEEAFTRLHGKKQNYGSEGSSTSKRSWGTQVDMLANRNKSDSLASTGNSSAVTSKTQSYLDNNSQTQTNSSLRRSSSLRFETHKTNSNENRNSTFKRSKSFKLNRGKHEIFSQHESISDESCKCKVETNRKQSVLSKFLRLGNSGNSTKTKTSNLKSANFSSQFPEINSSVIPYSEVIGVERKSKATQTINCGPEDFAALIIKQAKQASRHALAKNRNNNNDYDCKNRVCCCFDYYNCESNPSKHTRLNKQSNKCRFGPRIQLPITPSNECVLCNTETNKINSNRHDFTNNSDNWSQSNQQFYRQSNGSHKLDNTIKQNERLAHYNSVDKRATSPLYIRSNTFKYQTNQMPEERMKSYQTSKNLSSPQTSRLNNSTSLIGRPKTKPHLINTSFDTQYPIKETQFKFTQNQSSVPNQTSPEKSQINNSNHDFMVDNSVNVKIEIGSSAMSSRLMGNSGDKPDDSITQSHQNNNKSLTSTYVSSNSIVKAGIQEHMDSQSPNKHPILTSATTVTTTMTIPNVYSKNHNSNWVQSPTDAADIVKSLKLCNQENNTSKLSNKQNNLLSDLRINSIPHLSPIRQKVAKAKAEFFNSSCPQKPMVSNLLIEK